MSHPSIENLVAVETSPGQNRVLAVEWQRHDDLTCDGQHLDINTDGWVRCPTPGCGWQFDPDTRCPVHGKRGDA